MKLVHLVGFIIKKVINEICQNYLCVLVEGYPLIWYKAISSYGHSESKSSK